MTTLQNFLKTLKTTKRTYPSSVYNLLISSSSTTQTLRSPENPIISTLRRILTDPDIKSSECVSSFRFVLENPSLFSFQPDLGTHLSLSLRVLSERKFSVARELLKPFVLKYPFRDIASRVVLEECGGVFENKVVARLFNSMIVAYSNSKRYDEAVEVFECMRDKEVKIDEKALTLHLLNLRRSGEVELANGFFRLMVASGLDVVSVYSLTVVVSLLCYNGEIKRGRELVEEVETKANIVTFKCMIDCCVKRWDFEELGLVLDLMEKESVVLDLDSYKILIDGFASYGKVEEAERLVWRMHDEKLKVETYLYNLIINGYSRLGLVEKAFEMHSEMSSRGVVSNKDTYWPIGGWRMNCAKEGECVKG